MEDVSSVQQMKFMIHLQEDADNYVVLMKYTVNLFKDVFVKIAII